MQTIARDFLNETRSGAGGREANGNARESDTLVRELIPFASGARERGNVGEEAARSRSGERKGRRRTRVGGRGDLGARRC